MAEGKLLQESMSDAKAQQDLNSEQRDLAVFHNYINDLLCKLRKYCFGILFGSKDPTSPLLVCLTRAKMLVSRRELHFI
jgi:hypothetical protein